MKKWCDFIGTSAIIRMKTIKEGKENVSNYNCVHLACGICAPETSKNVHSFDLSHILKKNGACQRY